MRRAALAALLVILPLTLGLRSVRPEQPTIDGQRLARDAVTMLTQEGWSASSSEHHLIGWLISGARRDCQIFIHFPAPSGESGEKFRNLARPIGPVTYQYRQRTSREFPRIVPVLAWHAQRYVRSFGLSLPTAPVIAIAQSPSCSQPPPDFADLRQRLTVELPVD